MLKGYKSLPKEDKEVATYVEGMTAKAKENAAWLVQKQEFMQYLIDKQKAQPYNDFFKSMALKLSYGLLSENMVSALRKCKDKDEGKAAPFPERSIVLKIKPWLMKDMAIDSRIISGTVKAESAKAYLITGHADMLMNACWCVRCGKELTEPASQLTGMGATCADKAGIPYDSAGVLVASQAERRAIRQQFLRKFHSQTFERWIPKSQVEEVVTEPLEPVVQVKSTRKSSSEARTEVKVKRAATKVITVTENSKPKAKVVHPKVRAK